MVHQAGDGKNNHVYSNHGSVISGWSKRFGFPNTATKDCEKLKRRAAGTERVYKWPATEQPVNGMFQS